MNFKTTYTLFAVLVGVLLVFTVSQLLGTKSGDTSYVFPSMHAKAKEVEEKHITGVEIERGSDKLVFERASGKDRWLLKHPYTARVENSLLNSLVRDLIALRKDDESDNLVKNLAHYGLDKPEATVTLHQGTDKQWKLFITRSKFGSEFNRQAYVASSDLPGVPLVVPEREIANAFKNVKEFRAKELALESSLNALAVTLADGQNELGLVKLEDTTKPDTWRFRKPDLGEADYHGADATPPAAPGQRIASVRDLLNALEGLKVAYNPDQKIDDFVAESVSDKELADKYGLAKGKPATLRIEVKSRTGGLLGGDKDQKPVTEVLLIGNKAALETKKDDTKKEDKLETKKDDTKKEDKAENKASDADTYYYARLESEANVVRLPARHVKPLLDVLGDVNVLRNKDLVQLDTGKVDAIDIKNTAGLLKLRKVGDPPQWKLFEDGVYRTADAQAVSTLLNVLTTRRQVKNYPSKPDKELGLEDTPNEITIWEDGIKDKKDEKSEPKLDKETVKLVFSNRKENEAIYVKRLRGTEVTRLAVPEGLLERVTEGKLAYLDKTLPLFRAADEVVKLTLQHADGSFELEKVTRDDKSSIWVLKQPKEQAGRQADRRRVETILDTLRTLYTDKLISEKASDRELDGFGLKPSHYQATVTIKKGDQTEDHVFLFGRETDKKDARYAKLGAHDLVFLVRPEVIDPLKTKELADTQIFNFEPGKIKEIKLTGWIEVEKRLTELHVVYQEPKPGEPKTWLLKDPDKLVGFHLDPTKVSELAKNLSRLSAERFLVFKSGPKPEHKLDEKSRALEIVLTLEGEEQPKTLTLGAPVDEEPKGYAAQSNSLPGDVFVLPENRFKDLLEKGLKHFSK